MADKLEMLELQDADVMIRPNIGDLHRTDFERAKGLIREGEIAARVALVKIREAQPLYKRVFRLAGRFSSRMGMKTKQNTSGNPL